MIAVFGEIHHHEASDFEVRRIAEMAAHDIDELSIAFRGPDRGAMTQRPDDEAWNPKPEAQSDRGGERANSNGDGAWRTAEQNWICQSAMDWRCETSGGFIPLH